MKNTLLGKHYTKIGPYHQYLKETVRAAARQRVIEDILSHAILHHVSCLCGNSNRAVLLASIDRWGLSCSSVLCVNCGIIRINPRWDEQTYEKIYSELYWPMAMGSVKIDQKRFDLSISRAMPYANFLVNHYDLENKDIMELGCSYGAGLQALKQSSSRLRGYDYDMRMLDYGHQFTKLDLRYGGAKEAIKDGDQFDLIILRHVFEHMLDPQAEIPLLNKLLKSNGALFIEVPGIFNSNWWLPDPLSYFNNFHAYSYCFHHLDCLMRLNGFSPLHGDEHIYSIWQKKWEELEIRWNNKDLVKKIMIHLYAMERKRRWEAFRNNIISLPKAINLFFRETFIKV